MFLRRFRGLPLLALLLVLTSASPPAPPWPMSHFVLGVLYRGPSWTRERTSVTDSLQASHMANIHRMADLGFLVGAGPMRDDGDLRGLFIFRADSVAHVRPLLDGDGAIAAGRLRCLLLDWTAPAGIGDGYAARAKQRPDNPDSMVTYTVGVLRPGPRFGDPQNSPRVRAALEAHLANMTRLARRGTLIAAGPLEGDREHVGVFVWATDTTEARRLALADPAVKAGLFRVEIHPWWVAYGVIPGH